VALLILEAFMAVSAFAGGIALVVGSIWPSWALGIPVSYLQGSPFDSYLVPGLILAIVLGGVNAWAFALLVRRHPFALFAGAIAAFDGLIWIAVELMWIPFGFLHAVYFTAPLIQIGFVMLALGLGAWRRQPAPARAGRS
ncbi:MAG: hypothetical protein ABUL47_00430, partial [Leifsonia sp.]